MSVAIACTACAETKPPAPPAAVPAPPPKAAPNLDPARVKGRLAPEIIQKIVRANFDGMKKCYETGLARNGDLRGRISTKFVIEVDGHVEHADEIDYVPPPHERKDASGGNDEGGRFPDRAVADCVVAKFSALTFPRPEGGIVTVVYPIVFQPGD